MLVRDLNWGQRRKRAGRQSRGSRVPKAEEKGRRVEEHVEMGGLGKVNLRLFTDEPRLEQMKHLLQVSVSRG